MRNKVDLMKEIERYEDIYIELLNWEKGENLKKVTAESIAKSIETESERDNMLVVIRDFIDTLKKERETRNPNYIFLSEIIAREKPKFTNNNLILSPVGSGKTTFAKTLIGEKDKVLFLVSTTSLKTSLAPNDNEKRSLKGNRMYTTKNGSLYGEGKHKILVATYHEFGERIKYVDDFATQFDLIICDEIHSLPLYQDFDDSSSLLVAMRYLFDNHHNQPKYYFTATTEHIEMLRQKSDVLMRNISIFDYLKYPNIMKYTPLSSYKITSLEQSRQHLRARKESIHQFGHKIFAFCKTIQSQNRLKEICEDEGFRAQIYWSVNNKDEAMDEEQIEEMRDMMDTGILPDKYDVIIVNSAMQEGWDLKDDRVKLAIMNTTNETEYVQALGRIRRDLDVLVYRVKDDDESMVFLSVPKDYLDIYLTSSKKDDLCSKLAMYDNYGRLYKWRTIKQMLVKQGFLITEKTPVIDGKRTRVSIIHNR